MKIWCFSVITVLLIYSNECRTVSNEEESIAKSESSTLSADIQECTQSSDCPVSEGCIKKQCKSPCSLDVCGYKAECVVINHNPVCRCGDKYIGDPFIECIRKDGTSDTDKLNFGTPPPCGFFSSEREGPDGPICACLPGYSGTPPKCSPQCIINEDCAADQVCFTNRCTNICGSVCSVNADCKVVNHATICECKEGFKGDPYAMDCKPSKDEGLEKALPTEDFKDCSDNEDCSQSDRCVDNKCKSICGPEVCGIDATCRAVDHKAVCYCEKEYDGNPLEKCFKKSELETTTNSDSVAVPGELKECLLNVECPASKACFNNRCINACVGDHCGENADCEAQNHQSICKCKTGYTGNPFVICLRIDTPFYTPESTTVSIDQLL